MVNKLIITACILAFSLLARGQESLMLDNNENPFVPVFIAGACTGNISHDYYPGFHNLSPNGGLGMYIRLRPNLWISSELLYADKGCVGVREADSWYWGPYFEKYYLHLRGVELPVVVHIPYKPWMHLSAGLSYTRLLKSSETLYTSPDVIYVNQQLYSFNKQNVDYIIGCGLHANSRFYLNVRYQHSIMPVRTWDKVHPLIGAGNQYAANCSLQLTYLLRRSNNRS